MTRIGFKFSSGHFYRMGVCLALATMIGCPSVESEDPEPSETGGSDNSDDEGGQSGKGGKKGSGGSKSGGGGSSKGSGGGSSGSSGSKTGQGGATGGSGTKTGGAGEKAGGGGNSTGASGSKTGGSGTKTGGGGTKTGGGGSISGGAGSKTGGGGEAGAGTAGAAGSGGEDEPITGYLVSGTWKGFGWADTYGTGNTITPKEFTDATDWPLCAKGTVKGATDGSNGAMVGWNLNQEKAKDAPIGTVTKTKSGIILNIKNNSSTQLRLQIQGPDGADDATQRWCTEIGSTSGDKIFVAYDAFNTECWPGGEGVAYKGEPIAQAIIQVPSTTTDVNFDFCVNGITEGEGGTSTSTGCDLSSPVAGSALSGTLSPNNKFQRTSSNTGTPQIYVQNNVFGQGGDYTISYNGPSFSIGSFNGNASTSGAPIGYPSLFIGSSGGDGQATAGSNLAKKVGSLTKVPTALRWSGGSGQFNVAYDVWFSGSAGDTGSGGRTFLMVWFHRTGSIYAEGQSEGHSGGTFSIGGKTFDTYVSDQFEGRPIISYVAKNQISEWSFDLNDFIKDAKSRKSTRMANPIINDDLYLTNVFAGTEVWSGAAGLKVDKFCIQVQ